ncbi:MAG: hypothetical protein JSW71_06940 [Gemmatimonadota bacterium]|nr:MAG: hypothetical protein JSW71_06940 [Gemmatimonadota bacterium]
MIDYHAAVASVLLLVVACDPGEVVLLSPDELPGHAPTASIHVVVDTPFASVAASLGWADGVPAAEVAVHLVGEPFEPRYTHVAVADSLGNAVFSDLLYGLYEVWVQRPLTASELIDADSAVHLFGGGRRLRLPTPRVDSVTVVPDHGATLVFSELGLNQPVPWETAGTSYEDAKYVEVYNNSDTTIYLDGKLLGIGWHTNKDFTPFPCSQTEPLRNDPEGIWASSLLQFPGAGTDYPLQPGHTALVAHAAVDHRPVHPGLYDLRHADFEWGGWQIADNPDVPNLADIGPQGMWFYWPLSFDMPLFLANPVDWETLPRYMEVIAGRVSVRIPRAVILDTWAGPVSYTPCLTVTHRLFERLPGPPSGHGDFDNGLSAQRRILYVLPDGRKVLQDTETSMVDFVKAPRSPGWIPDSLGR